MLRAINRTIVSVARLVSNLVLMIPNLFFKRKRALAVFKAELKAHGIDEKLLKNLQKATANWVILSSGLILQK